MSGREESTGALPRDFASFVALPADRLALVGGLASAIEPWLQERRR
jgi:hypothetical protein